MTGSQGEQEFSIYRFRWVGYGLLILSLLDAIALLIPPDFLNRAWELQTIGSFVERVPVPLLGLALIFFGEEYERTDFEEIILKIMSWLTLLLAVLFLLMMPLGIFSTLQINSQNSQQITAQSQQQLSQLQLVQERLNKGSPEELKNLATELTRLGLPVEGQNPEELKNQILSRIPKAKQELEKQVQTVQANQRLALLKNSVKWMLGALIASVLFFTLWRGTSWAR